MATEMYIIHHATLSFIVMQILIVVFLVQMAFRASKFWKGQVVFHILFSAFVSTLLNGYLWTIYPGAHGNKNKMYSALAVIITIATIKLFLLEVQKKESVQSE